MGLRFVFAIAFIACALPAEAQTVSAKDLAGHASAEQIEADITALAKERSQYASTERRITLSEQNPDSGIPLVKSSTPPNADLEKEANDRMGRITGLESEIKRAGVGDVNGAVKAYVEIADDVDMPYTAGDLAKAFSGSSEKARASAIRALGGKFDRIRNDEKKIARFREFLRGIELNVNRRASLADSLITAQESVDAPTLACASVILSQLVLSEPQALRATTTLVRERFATARLDWESQRIFDVALQMTSTHIGRGDTTEAAYLHVIAAPQGITGEAAGQELVTLRLVSLVPKRLLTEPMLDALAVNVVLRGARNGDGSVDEALALLISWAQDGPKRLPVSVRDALAKALDTLGDDPAYGDRRGKINAMLRAGQ